MSRQGDIRERIRRAEARPLDAECKPLVWDVLSDARHEITRLMLRVAELESAAKLAPAANVAAQSNQADAEPVAWGVVARQTNEIPPGCASPRRVSKEPFARFYDQSQAKNFALKTGGTVVPLYRSPPPPRGWLTAEEREAVRLSALINPRLHDGNTAATLRALLARNAPRKVRLPSERACENENPWAGGWNACLREVRAALAAAGVEVEE